MTSSDDDRTAQLLRQALAEEASEVKPGPDGLQTIQRRTAAAASPPRRASRFGSSPMQPLRRPWVLGALGAGAATAAVIVTVVLVGENNSPEGTPVASRPSASADVTGGPDASTDPSVGTDPGATSDPSTTADPTATTDPSPTTDPGGTTEPTPVRVYYVGPDPSAPTVSPRLYSEVHTVQATETTSHLASVHEFLTGAAADPDYRSGWPAGVDVSEISQSNGVTTIALKGDADLRTDPGSGPADARDKAAIQALLATAGVKGAATFTYNGAPVERILASDASVSAQAEEMVRAPISIENVTDGQTVANPVTIVISGNVFEGTVNWRLTDSKGRQVDDGYVTTSMGVWTEASAKLGSLEPGTYTFEAFEYSAENGEPLHPDDKTFTVK